MNRVSAWLVFLGLFATYASLTPAGISGMGYAGEEMQSGDSMLAFLRAKLAGQRAPAIEWSRHGPVAVVLNLPFQVLGKWIVSEDSALSLQPILETSLLATLLFVWLGSVTAPPLAFFLAMTGAFATMLWPYAYIGLETKQSLFLLLAGYRALECRPVRSFWTAILFGLCCAIAIGVKSTSVVLVPCVAYLIYVQFRQDWRGRLRLVFTTLAVIALVVMTGAVARNQYWLAFGGTSWTHLKSLLNGGAFQYLGSVLGMFGSPNKGLLLYSPPVLLSLYAIPRTWREHRALTVFALLAVGGIISGFACLRFFADEVWGPRYLHSCVAPMLLLLGASRKEFSLRRDALMIPLLALGLIVSFLGAFYYYGNLHSATMQAGMNNEEELLGDPQWNHVDFNSRLFAIWWSAPASPVIWTPVHHWMWKAPPGESAPKAVDLKTWSQPQSMLIRAWRMPHKSFPGVIWYCLLLFAFSGPVLLIVAAAKLSGAQPTALTRVRAAPRGSVC